MWVWGGGGGWSWDGVGGGGGGVGSKLQVGLILISCCWCWLQVGFVRRKRGRPPSSINRNLTPRTQIVRKRGRPPSSNTIRVKLLSPVSTAPSSDSSSPGEPSPKRSKPTARKSTTQGGNKLFKVAKSEDRWIFLYTDAYMDYMFCLNHCFAIRNRIRYRIFDPLSILNLSFTSLNRYCIW